MFAKVFDLPAVKTTEYRLRVSITKEGIEEEDVRLGLAKRTMFIDTEKREIRYQHNGELLARFGDIKLPIDQWSVDFGLLPSLITPDEPSGSEKSAAYFGSQ